MKSETIVAVFENAERARTVVRELEAAGISTDRIKHYDKQDTSGTENVALGRTKNRGFWSWLLGEETADQDYSAYDRAIERGGTVVTVITEGQEADRAASILEAHSPLDLQEHGPGHGWEKPHGTQDVVRERDMAESAAPHATATPILGSENTVSDYSSVSPAARESFSATEPETTTAEQVIPLAAEQLEVGKRDVQSGVARIKRYVVERPVEQQVSLRDETVTIERRPVSGAESVASDAFTDKTVEVTETREEAVVGKTARVVEEVVVGKRAQEHVQTVQDSVRREEVEVERPADKKLGDAKPGNLGPPGPAQPAAR